MEEYRTGSLSIEEMNQIRTELRLSYTDISNASNVPTATVQKVLAGETQKPRSSTWGALQEAMSRFKVALLMKDDASLSLGFRTRIDDRFTLKDYYALPEDSRKELIDGVFYDLSCPTFGHQNAIMTIAMEFKSFIHHNGGSCIPIIAPFDVQLDRDEYTMLQPDLMIVCDPSKVMRSRVYGAPDLVVEVLSQSTKRKDMLIKAEKYERAGVREYWMIDVDAARTIVYDFANEDLFRIYGRDDEIPVGIYDGALTLNLAQIFKDNIAE